MNFAIKSKVFLKEALINDIKAKKKKTQKKQPTFYKKKAKKKTVKRKIWRITNFSAEGAIAFKPLN